MPTYQYACTGCGHEHEAVQSFTDDPLTTCPECGGQLRKLFGNVGVVFKGSGFYRTDSRKGESTTSGATSADSSTKKSDATPASTTATSAASSSPAPASTSSTSSS